MIGQGELVIIVLVVLVLFVASAMKEMTVIGSHTPGAKPKLYKASP